MFLYFRTISHKISPFVTAQKQVVKVDRLLWKRVKSSAFLEEFLRTQSTVTAENYKDKILDMSINQFLYQPSSLTCLNDRKEANIGINMIGSRHDTNDGDNESINTKQYSLATVKRLDITAPRVTRSLITDADMNNDSKCDRLYLRHDHLTSCDNSLFTSTRMLYENKRLYSTPESNSQKQVTFAGGASVVKEKPTQDPSMESEKRPTQDQLEHVLKVLSTDLPKLFRKSQDYRIYTYDMIFINNIRGIETKGIHKYAWQLLLLKLIGHLKFAYITLDILKITSHTEDDTVKVRWRIKGISGLRIFILFWKFNPLKIKEAVKELEAWYDGFSTFYVNGDGLVYKHVVDKMMPDDSIIQKINPLEKAKTPIATKLL